MNGCCRDGQLNFLNGFAQLSDFWFGGSSRLFHKLTPAHALPFCERWKQSKDSSDKSRFPSTFSWKRWMDRDRKSQRALRHELFTSSAHKTLQFIALEVKRYRKNNYWNICRPGLIHDGELVEAPELLQLRHLFLGSDESSLDFLPSVTEKKDD